MKIKQVILVSREDMESLVKTLELNIQSLENREINIVISSLITLRNNIEKNLNKGGDINV